MALAVALCATAPLGAQSAKTIVSGAESTLVTGKQRIAAGKAPQHGVARVDSAGTPAARTFSLLYKASDVTARVADTVEYTLEGGAAQKLAVTVEPKAAGVNASAPGGSQATAPTAPKGLDQDTYSEGFKTLFLMFVLAAVLESALASIFNWRPFIDLFNARAVRPLVSFIVALIVVNTFDLDLITRLVNASTKAATQSGASGLILTALVLAGGSSGVNSLLVTLGYREKKTPETATPKPPPTKAWIAVRVTRQRAVASKPVLVHIGAVVAPATLPPLAGTITGTSKKERYYFVSDRGRFPTYGGHEVPAGSVVYVAVVGVDASGAAVTESTGPYTVAGGAIIDLSFEL
ncbi:MAG: hypothetical protein V4550_12160 [Gemmatimonadota bacterium]